MEWTTPMPALTVHSPLASFNPLVPNWLSVEMHYD